jgi:solute carrier family 25 folate transporter 32
VSWGSYFFLYENAKARWSQGRDKLQAQHHLLSACEAGVFTVLLTNPIWVIKTRLQLQRVELSAAPGKQSAGELGAASKLSPALARGSANLAKANLAYPQYKGIGDAFSKVFAQEGVAGLYAGVVPALCLVSHGAIQFVIYEQLKEHRAQWSVFDSCSSSSSIDFLAMGALSKVGASVATYPYQTIRTRLQQVSTRHRGMIECAQHMWQVEGALSFYKGLLPNLVKIVPSSAITFWAYEVIRGKLEGE